VTTSNVLVMDQPGQNGWHAQTNGMGVASAESTNEGSTTLRHALPDVRACHPERLGINLIHHLMFDALAHIKG